MPLPSKPGAYEDCYDKFDLALANPPGIIVWFADYGEAKQFQLRMSQARTVLRAETKRMYESDDPRYDKSEYDRLVVRNPLKADSNEWYVRIEFYNARVLATELIGPPDETTNP